MKASRSARHYIGSLGKCKAALSLLVIGLVAVCATSDSKVDLKEKANDDFGTTLAKIYESLNTYDLFRAISYFTDLSSK